jgi:hypothetical protein
LWGLRLWGLRFMGRGKLVRARGHGRLLGIPGLPEFPAAADGGLFLTH